MSTIVAGEGACESVDMEVARMLRQFKKAKETYEAKNYSINEEEA